MEGHWFLVVFVLAHSYLYEMYSFGEWPPLTKLSMWVNSMVDPRKARSMLCHLTSTIDGNTVENKRSLFCRNRAGGAAFEIFSDEGLLRVRPTTAAGARLVNYLTGGHIRKVALEKFLATTPRKEVLSVVTGTQELLRRQILAGVTEAGQLVLPENDLVALLDQMCLDQALERVEPTQGSGVRYTRYRRPVIDPSLLLPPSYFLRPLVITHGERERNPRCMICHDDFQLMEEVAALPCFWAHGCAPVHRICIQPWLDDNNSCPLCNRQVRGPRRA